MKWLGWFFDVWAIPMVLIVLCIAILIHLGLILVYGQVVFEATEPIVLWSEAVTVVIIAAYSTLWLLRRARKTTRKR